MYILILSILMDVSIIPFLNLISKYKSGSFSLKKLSELIKQLYSKDPQTAKFQIESVISIFEDPRFSERHKKKLISKQH